MLRLFLAVHIPPSAPVEALLSELRATGERVKAVEPGNLHVTLKFLGDTPESKLDAVVAAAGAAVDGAPFRVKVKGTGTFGRGAPSVFWAGVEDDGPLSRLAGRLDEAMSRLGYAREARRFSPHLTLARAKGGPTRLSEQALARRRGDLLAEATVDRVLLMRSQLTPAGPVYTEAASFPLGGAPPKTI